MHGEPPGIAMVPPSVDESGLKRRAFLKSFFKNTIVLILPAVKNAKGAGSFFKMKKPKQLSLWCNACKGTGKVSYVSAITQKITTVDCPKCKALNGK